MKMHGGLATLTTRSRRGRKPKPGPRYPSGKLLPDDPMAVVLAQPHRRHLPIDRDKNGRVLTDHRRDQRAESSLGRMRLAKLITEGQYQAGVKYREAHIRYRAAIAARDSLARNSGGGARVVPDETEKRHRAIFEAALACLDRRSAPPIGRVILNDCPVLSYEVTDIRRGLMRLAEHWGMV